MQHTAGREGRAGIGAAARAADRVTDGEPRTEARTLRRRAARERERTQPDYEAPVITPARNRYLPN